MFGPFRPSLAIVVVVKNGDSESFAEVTYDCSPGKWADRAYIEDAIEKTLESVRQRFPSYDVRLPSRNEYENFLVNEKLGAFSPQVHFATKENWDDPDNPPPDEPDEHLYMEDEPDRDDSEDCFDDGLGLAPVEGVSCDGPEQPTGYQDAPEPREAGENPDGPDEHGRVTGDLSDVPERP